MTTKAKIKASKQASKKQINKLNAEKCGNLPNKIFYYIHICNYVSRLKHLAYH